MRAGTRVAWLDRMATDDHAVTLLLAGDVMTGRGVDQILPHPSEPELREPYVSSARTYVELAERAHGPVPAAVAPAYPWGEGIEIAQRVRADLTLVNLETSVTTSSDFWPDKSVHYRMHPRNIECLRAARLDVCTLANNHVLDFGTAGLLETLDVLRGAGIASVGAGRDLEDAVRPIRAAISDARGVVIAGMGTESSGIPRAWAAAPSRPGVHLLRDLSPRCADEVAARLRATANAGDLAIASIHWGGNWGHAIDPDHVAFAHRLIEHGVDLVHGHSSHHVRALEVHEGKLILYGCGDLVTDYEGIRGNEAWRGDIGVMYVAALAADGMLRELRLVPTRMHQLRLVRAGGADARWLLDMLGRVSRQFGSRFDDDDGALSLRLPP